MSGLKRRSTRGVCCLLCLTAARSAPADFLGLVEVVRTDLTICQDARQDFIDEPLTVCGFYAVFDDPTDRLLSTGYADITTTDPAGFFQHPANFADVAPRCDQITNDPPFGFPDLVCDSFVTIGLECNEACDSDYGCRGTRTCPDFDSDEFNNNGHLVGGWYATPNADGTSQGDAGAYPDNLVLFLQLSVRVGESVSGPIDVYWKNNDVGEVMAELDVILECPGPCPADFDGDGRVGSFDLALLLNSWGPNPADPADFDGDGIVGTFDLALLLGAWGPCP